MTREEILGGFYTIDLGELALKAGFGSMKFEQSYPMIVKARDFFKELEDLGNEGNLTEEDLNNINSQKNTFAEHLAWLSNFAIEMPNAKQEHDDFEMKIKNFYNSLSISLRPIITYLRQETAVKTTDQKEIKKQIQEASKARSVYEELYKEYKNQIEVLQTEKENVEKSKGQVGATKFGKFFESQAEENNIKAKNWNKNRERFFEIILWIVSINFLVYLYFLIGNNIPSSNIMAPKSFFTLEYAVVKFALLSILFYGLNFSSRNYNIESNLYTTNKHRQNVADTINSFLSTDQPVVVRSEIIKQGIRSMFEHTQNGYITKKGDKNNSYIHETINQFLNPEK